MLTVQPVLVKQDESECFWIHSGVRQECIMTPLALQCIHRYSDGGSENGDREDQSEISGGGTRVEIAWAFYVDD